MTASQEKREAGRDAPVDHARRAALLTRLQERVSRELSTLVDGFYGRLAAEPGIAELLGRLSADELHHLKQRQGEHLVLLLSPTVSARVLHDTSRGIGWIHAMVGVEIDWYVEAVTDHRTTVLGLVGELFEGDDHVLAHTLVGDRLMSDLQGALLGYRDLDNAQHRVILSVTQAISDSRTVVHLASGALEALSCLDGVSVGFFARPDPDGRLQFEIGAGPGLDQFSEYVAQSGSPLITIDQTDHTGQGPAGRAWRTGVIERCDSYAIDPRTSPWRDMGKRLGWRASVAVPLADRHGGTRALVSLYALWPGYFASEACSTMVLQIKQSLETALSDIEERPSLASAVSGYADRATHLERLHRGEVEMHFQPVISLPDGRLTKLEALARLHGEGRLISPAEFLPAFGDDELFDLFEQGTHQALDALRVWESSDLHTGVSLNLPAISAEDDRYARLVAELLKKYDVAAHRLTLELLETGFVDRETSHQHRSLDEFKNLGVRLAQDDLGSGYSSLLRLRHFAFDDVKIDQSLVRGTELAPGAALHFIEPINDIAHSLGLSVVIEGLENDGLIEAGVQLDVDEGQGYGIARPMPLGDVVGWARDFRLDVDPLVPRTPVGALAAHVAWEHRTSALADHQGGGTMLDLEACALTGYLRAAGRDDIVRAHREVHAAAVAGRGSDAHRAAWSQLASLVSATRSEVDLP